LQNITKILKGLNSDTFNYLYERKDALKISPLINNYQDQIDTNLFMDDCLRVNKPCKFSGIAKKWVDFERLRYTHEGKPYSVLEEAIGPNRMVDVYVDLNPDANFDSTPTSSFKESMLSKMKYQEFLDKSG